MFFDDKINKAVIYPVVLLIAVSVLAYGTAVIFQGDGMLETDVLRVEGDTIILGVGCRGIVADTSPERAESIKLGLEGSIIYRPTGHDIYVETLKSFNITLESVSMDKFDGQFYYSTLLLRGPEKVLKLDSKPSDAFAIAVRVGAPIYVNESLLDEHGTNIC